MTLIEFGGWLFWLAVSAIIIWDIACIENDAGWPSFWGTAIGVFALWWITGATNPLPWIGAHWASILMFIGCYIIAGAVWGLAKWWFYLHNSADQYELKRDRYQNEYNSLSDFAKASRSYKDWLQANYKYPPMPQDHKSDITMWMVWWPLSGFWTLLNDPLKRIYRIIYQNLVSTYTRMANSVFGGRFTELK